MVHSGVAFVLRERNGRFILDVDMSDARRRMFYRPNAVEHELLMEHVGERVHVTVENGEVTRVKHLPITARE